ncbi:hypothetical protein HPB49_007791 [Dermacentor silvarum]|uniref:Uncharacterized protein n=1 Tax=Dermacentor silvarum TaxID=543639 RepID=A0ACB8DBR9_DERSI|nr:hypothetical protein HPB49_007791 [Dermacentor silvarum]
MDASQCPLPSELSNGPAVPNAAAGSSIGAAGPRDDGRQRNTVYYRRQVSPKRLHAERLINEYQLQLQSEAWQSTCERLGRVPGLQGLWRIFRSLSGKGRGNSPFTELFTKADPASVEEEIITTFFPHASLTPPVPPNACAIPEPDPDLDRAFSMGEMLAAIKSGHPRSAQGHDRITWQELRNLGEEAQDALLRPVGFR